MQSSQSPHLNERPCALSFGSAPTRSASLFASLFLHVGMVLSIGHAGDMASGLAGLLVQARGVQRATDARCTDIMNTKIVIPTRT